MCVSAGGEYRGMACVSLRVDLSVGTLGGQFWELDCVRVALLGDPVGVGGLCFWLVYENVGALGGGWKDGLCV